MKLQTTDPFALPRQAPAVIIVRMLLNSCALFLTSFLFKNMHFDGFLSVLLSAFLLDLVNTFIRPVLLIVTLPLTIFTLGAAIIPLNGLILFAVSRVVPGFRLEGFWTVMGAGLVMGILGYLVTVFVSSPAEKTCMKTIVFPNQMR